MLSNNQQLVLVNLLNFSCTAYTEEQFHDKLLHEITRNTVLIPSDDTKTFFIKWYQKAYNQSRRKYIIYHDDYGNEYKETPYSFAYLDKKHILLLLVQNRHTTYFAIISVINTFITLGVVGIGNNVLRTEIHQTSILAKGIMQSWPILSLIKL